MPFAFTRSAGPAGPDGRSRGFTLVEIMIVVALIGILAAIAIPAVRHQQQRAQNSRFVSDLRVFAAAFETYATKNGRWPADANPGAVPTGMSGELRDADWTVAQTPIGGHWDWDYKSAGVTACISVHTVTLTPEQMKEIDRMIDDGNLATGNFRTTSTSGYYIYILQP